MVEDPKVALAGAARGRARRHRQLRGVLRHIMEESMEALIHHFKMVTEGVRVPAGEVYQPVESPRGELGFYVVSDGGYRPYRVKIRDPSFVNLQAVPDDGRGRPRRRRDRRDRQPRSGDGRRGSLMPVFDDARLAEARRDRRAVTPRAGSARRSCRCSTSRSRSRGTSSREGMREVAELLGLTTAEVEAVATLLHDVAAAPDRARTWSSVCTNLSCALRGAERGLRGRVDAGRASARRGASRRRRVHACTRRSASACATSRRSSGELREPRPRHARAACAS